MEIFKLLGTIAVNNSEANSEIEETTNKASGLGEKLKSGIATAGKWGAAIVGGAAAVGTAFVALANETREYRTEMGKLDTAFQSSGHSSEAARETYSALNAVLGDSGQAVEAANHLAKLCDTEQELQSWTDICTGVYATFGASLPIEGLTESANETAKVGQVTGSLADALNWAGVSEEEFNTKLAACSTEQERQQLITSTLTGIYSEASAQYKETNKDIIEANTAQGKLTDTMAKMGAIVEPAVTKVLVALSGILPKLLPIVDTLVGQLIPALMPVIEQILPILIDLIDQLAPYLSDLMSLLLPVIVEILEALLPPLLQIVSKLLPPLLELLRPILELLGPIIDLLEPIIDLVVSILDPLAQLISDLLTPLISVASKLIEVALIPLQAQFTTLSGILTGVVNVAFSQIMNGVETAKGVFSGLIQFLKGVFTGDWQSAWEGVKNIFVSIAEGIGNAFKTPINFIIDCINSFIRGINKLKIPDWVPGVGGKGFSIGEIPRLQEGGVLERGQVGFLEGNGAEAVVPLEHNKKWISAVAEDMHGVIGGSEVVELLKKLLAAIQDMDDALVDKFIEALATMRFDIGSREFARLVKAVN